MVPPPGRIWSPFWPPGGRARDEYSREHHTDVLHFDIGGGTSNLALYSHGELAATGCLDVGGRLIKA